MVDLNRVLVTGAGGMVGGMVPFGIKLRREDLDVTQPQEVTRICEKFDPTGILCLSSLDLRRSEADPIKAVDINVVGVLHLAGEASRRNIPLVVISTGAVFSGAMNDVFDEDSRPCPVNIYGQTKWLAEQVVDLCARRHLILRTGWLFGGPSVHNTNFVDRAYDQSARGEPIRATTDQKGSPTYLIDFLDALKGLLEAEKYGLYHVANEGSATAYDIADVVVKFLKSSSPIQPSKAMGPENTGPKRSVSEVLVSKRLALRPWREALEDYLKTKSTTGPKS